MRSEPIRLAIEKAGSVKALAEMLNVTPQAISQWKRIPADRVPDLERVSGIPRHELRPDMWEAPAPVKRRIRPAPPLTSASIVGLALAIAVSLMGALG
jgi:DNA-binding transcriptional regulator YdaS (Cro superfamily)